jgi:hypothetical protein
MFVIMHSGTLSSFVFRFFDSRAQKRNTDNKDSTMLPQAKRSLRAAPHIKYQTSAPAFPSAAS